MVFPYSTLRAPLELLAIMPPTVARLAVEMSGANRSPSGCNCAFSSSALALETTAVLTYPRPWKYSPSTPATAAASSK